MANVYVWGDHSGPLNTGSGEVWALNNNGEEEPALYAADWGYPGDVIVMFGDVDTLNYYNTGTSYGGNDLLVGDDRVDILGGDARYMNYWTTYITDTNDQMVGATATGGNDTLAGAGGIDNLYGDAGHINYYSSYAMAVGGDDVLNDGDGDDFLFGEAYQMNVGGIGATAVGGNDVLNGGEGDDTLFGDAYQMNLGSTDARAVGGDDELNGGAGDDTLFGDAAQMNVGSTGATAVGGDDVLNGGAGDDLMFGDARDLDGGSTGGHDTFVFEAGSGLDTIGDFRFGNDAAGRDLIDVSAMLTALAPDLPPIPWHRLPEPALAALARHFGPLIWDSLDDHITVEDGDSLIDLGAATGGEEGVDTITVIGVTDLTVDDFIFF